MVFGWTRLEFDLLANQMGEGEGIGELITPEIARSLTCNAGGANTYTLRAPSITTPIGVEPFSRSSMKGGLMRRLPGDGDGVGWPTSRETITVTLSSREREPLVTGSVTEIEIEPGEGVTPVTGPHSPALSLASTGTRNVTEA